MTAEGTVGAPTCLARNANVDLDGSKSDFILLQTGSGSDQFALKAGAKSDLLLLQTGSGSDQFALKQG